MGPLIYVLNLAVTNLLLGFAMAMLLGHGPQRWPHLGRWRWPVLGLLRLRRRPASTVSVQPAAPTTSSFAAPVAAVAARTAAAVAPASAPTVQATVSPATSPAAAVAAPAATPPKLAMAPPEEFGDLNWALPLDAVLAQFQSESQGAREEVKAVDERARRCAGSPSAEQIAACVADLTQIAERYLSQQEGALAMLDDTLAGDDEEHRDLGENVRRTAHEQSALLRSALARLANGGERGGLQEQLRELLSQTQAILVVCDRVSDCVAAAAAQLQGRQSPAPKVNEPAGPALPASVDTAEPQETASEEAATLAIDAVNEDALLAAVAKSLAEVGGLREGLPTT
jgi:hypothetical protein